MRMHACSIPPQSKICGAQLPHNWIHREDGQPRITRHEVEQVLGRVQDASFWSLD